MQAITIENGKQVNKKNRDTSTQIWCPSPNGYIKINIDATLDKAKQRVYVSFITRNHSGTDMDLGV